MYMFENVFEKPRNVHNKTDGGKSVPDTETSKKCHI